MNTRAAKRCRCLRCRLFDYAWDFLRRDGYPVDPRGSAEYERVRRWWEWTRPGADADADLDSVIDFIVIHGDYYSDSELEGIDAFEAAYNDASRRGVLVEPGVA